MVRPSQHSIKLTLEAPARYRIRVLEKEYAVNVDGTAVLDFPATRQDCTVYLFNLIPISGGKDPRDAKSISVLTGDRTVKVLSMNQVLKLPVDASGAHLLTIEGR